MILDEGTVFDASLSKGYTKQIQFTINASARLWMNFSYYENKSRLLLLEDNDFCLDVFFSLSSFLSRASLIIVFVETTLLYPLEKPQ